MYHINTILAYSWFDVFTHLFSCSAFELWKISLKHGIALRTKMHCIKEHDKHSWNCSLISTKQLNSWSTTLCFQMLNDQRKFSSSHSRRFWISTVLITPLSTTNYSKCLGIIRYRWQDLLLNLLHKWCYILPFSSSSFFSSSSGLCSLAGRSRCLWQGLVVVIWLQPSRLVPSCNLLMCLTTAVALKACWKHTSTRWQGSEIITYIC